MCSLRLRLVALFALTALIVAGVIAGAVQYFSTEQLMHVLMERGESPAGAQAMVDEYLGRVVLIGGVAAVLLGSLTAGWVLRRVLRPLERLKTATQSLAAGDLSTRVPEPSDAELRALAEAFNQMAASLEQGERLRRALVEDVAHELRTPLTSLRGYTEALADGVVDPTPEVLRTVHEEIERLTRLVEALDQLARGRLTSGQHRADLAATRHVDLAEVARRAIELASPALRSRRISVRVEPPPVVALVRAEPDAVGQVVSNLVQNAVRYTEDGGAVTVRLASEGPLVRCTVGNTGPGIPPEHLALIWERLHRADPSRSRASGGAGIGLAIVRDIVEAHGGDVGATSTDGRTEVWFRMPAASST